MGRPAAASRVVSVLFAVLPLLSSCSTSQPSEARAAEGPRQRMLLDDGWAFHKGDIEPAGEVVAAGYDDRQWQRVDVPHDYVLEGTYAQSPEKMVRGHGYLPYEVGWYRRHFVIPAADRGRVLRLDFDGAFRDSQVWLNGKLLGRHASGYTPFSYDVTQAANVGGDNMLVVRVDPRKWEGWWYEGGGIYRHVWLTALDPVHVAQWGTSVVSTVPGGDQGADATAEVSIRTTIENAGAEDGSCVVVHEVFGPDGKSVTKVVTGASAPAGGQRDVTAQVIIDRPKLWSVESPNLYQLRTTVMRGGRPADATTTNFGVRTLRFDPNKGFFLNGRHVEIDGVACHQDLGGLGIAVPDSLQEWRVRQLKAVGCNGWRTAHNMVSEAVLDACDRLGMLVMAENRHLGDAYTTHSQTGTKADDLSDLAEMIHRDRNHPSIIMWSMCNEEGLQGKPEGVAIFRKMMDVVHRYDRTRPITCAMNGGWLTKENFGDVEDILGVNYNVDKYDAIHTRHPDKMMFGSECTNEKTTRGEYADDPKTGMRSAYNLSEHDWLAVVDRPFMAGSYTWTGFDYRGEPNPYGWPDVSNNTGLLDLCGFPKDKAYYFKSCWSKEPMVHLVPGHWNWKEGQTIRVLAFSNAKRVELFLNGKSLGVRDVPHDAHAEWQVPYAAGELVGKGYGDDGKVVASDVVQTTGAPAHIELKADRTKLKPGAEDVVVVQAALVDARGRVVPDGDRRVTFRVTGPGRVLGTSNGNPADHDPEKGADRNSFHGRLVAVVEAGREPGAIEVTATAPDVDAGRLKMEAR